MTLRQNFINESFKMVAILEHGGDFAFAQFWLTAKTYGLLSMISNGINTSRDLLCGTYGSKPNMTKKLKTLEENDFISREVDKHDKRVWRFSLTQKAYDILEKLNPVYDHCNKKIFDNIDEQHIHIALEVIEKCIKNLYNMKDEDLENCSLSKFKI